MVVAWNVIRPSVDFLEITSWKYVLENNRWLTVQFNAILVFMRILTIFQSSLLTRF